MELERRSKRERGGRSGSVVAGRDGMGGNVVRESEGVGSRWVCVRVGNRGNWKSGNARGWRMGGERTGDATDDSASLGRC